MRVGSRRDFVASLNGVSTRGFCILLETAFRSREVRKRAAYVGNDAYEYLVRVH